MKFFKRPNMVSGFMAGRGIILRRTVWNAIGKTFLWFPKHPGYLRAVREWVMHGLGQSNYVSKVGRGNYWVETEEMRAIDQSDAAESHMKMFDLSDLKTFGVWTKTPFSGHFPWMAIDTVPNCTKKRINAIQNKFPQDIKFIIEAWMGHPEMHVSILEVCKSNYYGIHDILKLRRNTNITCEEFETQWLKTHKYL